MSRSHALVERFIEVQRWPTSRKVGLVSLYACFLTTINFGIGGVLFPSTGWIDMRFWGLMALLYIGHLSIVGVAAWRMPPSDGFGTLIALAVPYSVLTVVVIWGMGFLSGVVVVAAVSAVVTITLFDERVGRLIAFALTVGAAAGVVIVTTGWLEYAPALHDPDALMTPRVALGLGLIIALAVTGNVWFTWVMVSAGQLTSARLEAAQKLISRYVPAAVAEDILSGHLSDQDGHHRRKLTVFFSDLVGFSDIAEELEPEDLAMVLNEYFGEMTAIAHRHHGTVDELQGDALLILFGAPRATTDKEHALNAVRMAAEMHGCMDRLNARWRDAGITETLQVRMGINTGVVTVGSFGTAERMKYAALGKHVNVAARLQAIAKPGTTVLSYATYLLVKDENDYTSLGPQQLKGITKPVEAFVLA